MTVPLERVTRQEYESLAGFRYALRRFLRFSENAAISAGLTPQQHQALLSIHGFPGRDQITISELCERLQTEHHSAVGLVNRLCNQGLAVRIRSEEDRRKVFVKVTPKGRRMLEALSAAHREQLRRMGPELVTLLTNLGK